MSEIYLMDDGKYGMKWTHSGNLHTKGYAFDDGFLTGKHLAELCRVYAGRENLVSMLGSVNGIFSVVIDTEDSIFAANDRYGTFKLFYAHEDGKLLIGDDASAVASAANLSKINTNGVRDWYYSGFVSGDETLIDGVFSLNASKYLLYDKSSGILRIDRYHSFERNSIDESAGQLIKQLDKVCVGVGERFISAIGNKKVLVPLSGGVDSRFALMLLKRTGYDNVLCFTYGNPGGAEERLAAKAAETYGFEHVYIPYMRRQWRCLLRNTENLAYIRYASNLKATPHFSDLYAAGSLSSMFHPGECIVVPGHVGSVAESRFDTASPYGKSDIVENIIQKYFYFYGFRNEKINSYLKARISSYVAEGDYTGIRAQGIFDDSAYDTYRSNHLMMALRPYEYHGFDWYLPLMDKELVDFFKSVPLELMGKNKILLSDFVTSRNSDDPGLHPEPKTYPGKVLRNLKDRRYSCIHPADVFKLRASSCPLPGIPRVLYRYYRNFLSYVSAKTLQLILDKEIK